MKHTRLLLILLAVAMPGCASYRFTKEWRQWTPPEEIHHFPRKSEAVPNPGGKLDGRWVGQWMSDRHKGLVSKEPSGGNVKCVLTRIDPYRYRAHFEVKWMGFTEHYLAELYGREGRNRFHARGSFPVSPVFGGTYHYDATITPKNFLLRYDSRYDTGRMELTKVR
jgi:hypothetical protein